MSAVDPSLALDLDRSPKHSARGSCHQLPTEDAPESCCASDPNGIAIDVSDSCPHYLLKLSQA